MNTGDSIAHERAVSPLLDALGPLLQAGVFVFGSNDLYAPTPKNSLRYIWRTSAREYRRNVPNLPWDELGAGFEAAGRMNASNRRGRVKVGDLDIAPRHPACPGRPAGRPTRSRPRLRDGR